jgi:hypothetical protein
MRDNNPALAKLLAIPPALVEAVQQDAANGAPVFRAMTIENAHDLFHMLPTMTPAQRMDFMDRTAKLGNMMPKEQVQQQAGAQVVINIIRRKNAPLPESLPIEGNAVLVED